MEKASLVDACGADFTAARRRPDDAGIPQSRSLRSWPSGRAPGRARRRARSAASSASQGLQRRGRPAPDAVRRPGQAEGPALRVHRGPARPTSARSRRWKSTSRISSKGTIIYAGVDYEAILRQAEKEADVIVWDGGNNDMSFYKPDLTITVVDPHRPGHERSYYPGATNVRLADVIVVNKVDSAREGESWNRSSRMSARSMRRPTIVQAASPITVDDPRCDQGEQRACDRGRPDADARRDDLRCRDDRGQEVRRRGDHRSPSVCGRDDRGHVREVPEHRGAPSGHGVRRQADRRTWRRRSIASRATRS